MGRGGEHSGEGGGAWGGGGGGEGTLVYMAYVS